MRLPSSGRRSASGSASRGQYWRRSAVDIDLVRSRTWDVEGRDAASRAEMMPGHARVEAVGRKLLPSRQQTKTLAGNDPVNEPFITQIEQLQSPALSIGPSASYATRPQWHPPI